MNKIYNEILNSHTMEVQFPAVKINFTTSKHLILHVY